MNNIINRDLARIEKNIITLKNRTAENMIQLGQELLKAKEKVPHGEWGEWLREKVDFSQRSANQLMRIAKAFGANSQAISNLEITKVGLLLDVPEDKRESFIENHDLKQISTRELKEIIKETVEKKPSDSTIDIERDTETYLIDIDELKPLPDHEKYFPIRKGKDWIFFLNMVDKNGIIEPICIARDKTIISGYEFGYGQIPGRKVPGCTVPCGPVPGIQACISGVDSRLKMTQEHSGKPIPGPCSGEEP